MSSAQNIISHVKNNSFDAALHRKKLKRKKNLTLPIKETLSLYIENKFSIILSNGLNIYEPDNEKVIQLYKDFYKALTQGGILITSFLTPPPTVNKNLLWKDFDPIALQKQKAPFSDIIEVNWQTFRTKEQTIEHLTQAEFKIIDIIYDSQKMFPTIVCKSQMNIQN